MIVLELDGSESSRWDTEFTKTSSLISSHNPILINTRIGRGKDTCNSNALAIRDELSGKFPIDLHFVAAQ